MNLKKTIDILIATIMILTLSYLMLGYFGLLPDWFYNQCENISLETAQLRGCCEDRNQYAPTSWLFGEDDCNKYRAYENISGGEKK